MIVKIHVKVKFRFAFIDLAKWEESHSFPLPMPPVAEKRLWSINRNGVQIELDLIPVVG